MNGSTSASSSRSTSNSLYNSYGQMGLSGFERRNALIIHGDDSPSMTWTPFFESMQDADAGFMSKINGAFGVMVCTRMQELTRPIRDRDECFLSFRVSSSRRSHQ